MERKNKTCVILRRNGYFICPFGILNKRFCGDRQQSASCGNALAQMDSIEILHTEVNIVPDGAYPRVTGTIRFHKGNVHYK
jgi:hypothetical protein